MVIGVMNNSSVKNSVRIVGRLMLVLLVVFAGLTSRAMAQNDNLTAYVDRTDISVNDIITLTIRIGATLGSEPPALSGIDQDFDRLGTTVSSTYSSVNGRVEEWTEYRITLKPKRTGSLTIPALTKGSASTQPIAVSVGDATQLSGSSDQDIFLQTTVNKESIYVQEQLIYTIKLYYSVRFDQGAQLSNPQIENAVIQQLGSDQNYQEIVDGIRYDVTERKFVIFPQSSGELEIPSIFFVATIGGRSGISRLLSRDTPARQINLASETHNIEVKGIPDAFNGSTWLPARSITVNENWSDEKSELEVGESVTRNLTIRADGLSSSLLPALEYAQVDGLRFYPDQPTRQDSANSSGVIGVRSEGTAIVPAEEGSFTLPSLELAWWNTELDQMEVTTIPSRTFTVSGGQPASVMPAPTLPGSAMPQSGVTGAGNTPAQPDTLWVAAAIIMSIAWLFSTFMWIRTRQQVVDIHSMVVGSQQASPKTKPASSKNLPKPENSLRLLQQACEKNDLPNIRRWAITWGQAFYERPELKTLDQLDKFCASDQLGEQLLILERALYGNDSEIENFSANHLLKGIIAINRKGPTQKPASTDDNALPPLYRN